MEKKKETSRPNVVIEVEFKDDGFCRLKCEARDEKKALKLFQKVRDEVKKK